MACPVRYPVGVAAAGWGVWTATLPEADRGLLEEAGFEPIDLEARARGRPAALIWPAEVAVRPVAAGLIVDLTDLRNWKLRMLDQN